MINTGEVNVKSSRAVASKIFKILKKSELFEKKLKPKGLRKFLSS